MKHYASSDASVKHATAAFLLLGLALAAVARGLSGGLLPLDDAYIYLQYGRMAALGHPFHYAAGEPLTTGATSFLWLAIVSLLSGIHRAAPVSVETVVFLSQGLLVGTGLWLVVRLAVKQGVSPFIAAIAAGLLPLQPLWLFGALNGMETMIYGAGLLILIAVLDGASPWWLVIPASARPAGAVLSLAALFVILFRDRRSGRTLPMRSLIPMAIALAAAGLWPWILTGKPPMTWTAKALWVEPRPDIRAFYIPKAPYFALRSLWFGLSGARTQPAVGVAADLMKPDAWTAWAWFALLAGGVGMAFRKRRGRAAAILWIAATFECLLTAAWDGQDYRYLVAPLPLLVLAAAVGWFGGRERRSPAALVATALFFLAAALFPEPAWIRFARLYSGRSRDLRSTQVAAGAWIAANLDSGARVAAHDAGALAFIGGRPIVDLVGLVTPELSLAYRSGEGALWEALSELPEDRRPTHAAFVPEWMPRLSKTTLFDRRLMTTRGGAGRVDFEIWSLSWAGRDLSDVPASYGAAAGQPGLEVVDAVDIASAASERAHGFSAIREGAPQDPLTVVRDLGFEPGAAAPGSHAIDGGRDLSGPIHFRVRARPGAPALLVVRTASPRASRLTVRLGSYSEDLSIPRSETVFHEADVLIPEQELDRALERGGNTIDVAVEGDRHRAFHWWLLQPKG